MLLVVQITNLHVWAARTMLPVPPPPPSTSSASSSASSLFSFSASSLPTTAAGQGWSMVEAVLRVSLAGLWHQALQPLRLCQLVSSCSSRRGGELLVRSLPSPVLLLAVAMACSMTGE